MLTRGAVLAAGLQVRPVPADPDDDRSPSGRWRSGIELTPRASISSSRSATIRFRPPEPAMPPACRAARRRSRTRSASRPGCRSPPAISSRSSSIAAVKS